MAGFPVPVVTGFSMYGVTIFSVSGVTGSLVPGMTVFPVPGCLKMLEEIASRTHHESLVYVTVVSCDEVGGQLSSAK